MATAGRVKLNEDEVVLGDGLGEVGGSELGHVLIAEFQSALSHFIDTWLYLFVEGVLVELIEVLGYMKG